MRGDDRPQGRPAPQAAPERAARGPGGRDRRGSFGERGERGTRVDARSGRFDARAPRDERSPRLGDAAFRAQRSAVENAQSALRQLATQAHGEALVQLLSAWAERQGEQLPGAQDLGRGVSPSVRSSWVQAIAEGAGDAAKADTALLRLEMAAELPTPADRLDARRALQLQMLTRRNDPTPLETWQRDVADVLAVPHDDARARRLQSALRVLLRKG